TPPLASEVRLSGTPELAVRMSTTAETALLSAMLVDYGAGPTVTVAGKDPLEVVQEPCEPEDLADRTGCAEPMEADVAITPERVLAWGHIDVKNSPDLRRSQPLTPGKQYNVKWKTLPSEHVIPAGHRIGLVITGNYDANPTSNRPARDTAAIGSEITVYLNGSTLKLPVVGGRPALGL
ncbi:CocE/NonD family hydrolase C-terminal non-catalytic domain-containing protein, partial [Micromonospora azadirachtae]